MSLNIKSNGSQKKKDVLQWVNLSDYDIETARAMQKTRRYLYVLFCCQQALEKRLKALVVKTTDSFPPKSHDLIQLLGLARLEMDPSQKLFLRKITGYYIETRYPQEMEELGKKVTKELSSHYLRETQEMIKWLDQRLK